MVRIDRNSCGRTSRFSSPFLDIQISCKIVCVSVRVSFLSGKGIWGLVRLRVKAQLRCVCCSCGRRKRYVGR
jgi:hypothetical protein